MGLNNPFATKLSEIGSFRSFFWDNQKFNSKTSCESRLATFFCWSNIRISQQNFSIKIIPSLSRYDMCKVFVFFLGDVFTRKKNHPVPRLKKRTKNGLHNQRRGLEIPSFWKRWGASSFILHFPLLDSGVHPPKTNMNTSSLTKLYYFTNLDFSEIRGFPFLRYLLGWGRVRSR